MATVEVADCEHSYSRRFLSLHPVQSNDANPSYMEQVYMSNDLFLRQTQQILADFRENGHDYLTYISHRASHGDEAMVRQKLVLSLLDALGYNLSTEVDPEKRAGSGSADLYVTAVTPDPANPQNNLSLPACVWELKRTGILDLTPHEEQLRGYVLIRHVRYGVLTNGHEIRLYERVGEKIEFLFHVQLTAIAASQPTEADIMALHGLYDLLHREAFLNVERFKREIMASTFHPLRLSRQFPHNEDQLIAALEREIGQLKRLVLLNFHAHQQRAAAFAVQNQELTAETNKEHTAVLQSIQFLQERLKLTNTVAELDSYLRAFQENRQYREEDEFVRGALVASHIASHLQGADKATFENRTRRYYRSVMDYRRWLAKQQRDLAVSLQLVDSFQQWEEEIGIMVGDATTEFCLQTVYVFIARLLLIRICEDKEVLTQKISDGGYKEYIEFSSRFYDYIGHANRRLLDIAYEDTSYVYGHFFSTSVFEWYTWEEETIIRLLWVLNQYDFAEVSADLIGRIYEQYVNRLERKRKGQFYTPANVVGTVLDAAHYQGRTILGKRLLDPACGSGRFLVEAMSRLIEQWELVHRQSGLEEPIDYQEVINHYLRPSLYGLDVNRFACFLAELNLVVQVLDLFRRSNGKFTILRFHIYPTNSLLLDERNGNKQTGFIPASGNDLLGQERLMAELIKQRGSHPTNEEIDFRRGFDYIVGNPPYVRADNPGVAELRQQIVAANRYPSLYKKWDLYIPFTDLALSLLAEGGHHAFIVSDAYQTEEYATRSRQRLLQATTIHFMGFAPGVYFFEGAAVFTFIYGLQNKPPDQHHQVRRVQFLTTALDNPHHVRQLPALNQTKWGQQIFRPEFTGDVGLDLEEFISLGQICYVNSGLELQSHERFDRVVNGKRHKLFVKDDLIAIHKSATHKKQYVEGEDINWLGIHRFAYLEWGTQRVPAQLRRARFPELFENPKIIMGETSGVYYDETGEFVNNHSVRNFVPYHFFIKDEVLNRIARAMAREINDADVQAEVVPLPANFEFLSQSQRAELLIKARAARSPQYDLGYLTALLNCRWLRHYMMTFVKRGSRQRFYPDDLKKWPIAPASAEVQGEIAYAVHTIMAAKKDIQEWERHGHRLAEGGVRLHVGRLLDIWRVPTGNLLTAVSFITPHLHGSLTRHIEIEGKQVVFRKSPRSWLESEETAVVHYLYRYLRDHVDELYSLTPQQLTRAIRIPQTQNDVIDFMTRLEAEEQKRLLRWLDVAQREAWLEEMIFELYGVTSEQRDTLNGRWLTFSDIPNDALYVSVLRNEQDTPMKRVAFQWQGQWVLRLEESLPQTVLLWCHNGSAVQTHWVVLT